MRCFYHKADLDGVCSGAIIHHFHPECEMIPFDYGWDFPWGIIAPGEEVYIVDLCLEPFEQMTRLSQMANLTWIDHHKSALEHYKASGILIEGLRAVGEAACELCWRYEDRDRPIPRAVKLLGRYDVWDHTFSGDVLPFQYGLRSRTGIYDPHDPMWAMLLNEEDYGEVGEFIKRGVAILAYQEQADAAYAKLHAFGTELGGIPAIAMNGGSRGSRAFKTVFAPDKHKVMIWFVWGNNGFWNVSLYADNTDVDVSKIAVAYGGGGHANAAGFRCRELPFPPFCVSEGEDGHE